MKKLIVFVLLICASQLSVAQHYYKTPSGKKYHKGSCRMVDNVSQAVTLDQAGAYGLTACKICRPQGRASTTTNITKITQRNTPRGEARAKRCIGYTKKRNRCKRRTRIGNGYCFQHNPERDNYVKPSIN